MDRTLKSLLIALSIASFSTLVATDGLASAPTELEIANLDQHTVFFGWNFTVPSDLRVQDIVFSLTIRENGREIKKATVDGAGKLRYEVAGLQNGTSYSLEIFATHSNRTIGGSLLANFTTMPEDWPVPEIRGYVIERKPHLEYYVEWAIPRNDSLLEFILFKCLPECEQQTMAPNKKFVTLVSPYSTKIHISVAAIYVQPLDRRIERHSIAFNNLSSVGPPSVIGELLKRELVGDTLQLAWDPPSEPRGPIDRYETEALDLIEPHSTQTSKTRDAEASVKCPSYACIIRIRAVNVETETGRIFGGEWFTFRQTFRLPEAAKDLKIVDWKSMELRFEINPSVSFPNLKYLVDILDTSSGSPSVADLTGPREKRIFDLEPYTTVQLNITTYVSSEKYNFHLCGGSLDVNLTSNVAAPSGVRDLNATFSAGGDPILSWREPEKPSGPIDGYRIVIEDASYGTRVNQTTIPHHAGLASQTFTYEGSSGPESLKFYVAAFNYDLESRKPIIGEETSVVPSKPFGAWAIIGVALAIGLFAILVGILLYKRRRFGRERPEFRTSYTIDDTMQY